MGKSRVYFNPNWDPKYFYPLIKPLTLIYDEVIIWSPIGTHLERNNFSPGEFIRACQGDKNTSPVIIPAYRSSWFDKTYRKNHPDKEVRRWDSTFESYILKYCRREFKYKKDQFYSNN